MTRPCGRNGVFSAGQALQRGVRARRLVRRGQAPAEFLRADGHRHQVGLDLARRVGGGDLALAGQGVGVGPLPGDRREPVVQVLRGHPHEQGGRHRRASRDRNRGFGSTPSPIGWRPMCSTPPGDGDVGGAERDLARRGGDRGHRARAHPVDRVAGHGRPAARRGSPRTGRSSAPGRRSGWSPRRRPRRPGRAAGPGCAAAVP